MESSIINKKKSENIRGRCLYATNDNRVYVTKHKISTDFKAKGRHKEHNSLIAKMITKERASRLEGSFGTDKEYFLQNKIKARAK